jgi:hypothetical protein
MSATEKKPRKKKDILPTPTLSPNALTLEAIDSIASEYEQQKEIKFTHGSNEFTVNVDVKFQITKLNDMVTEFGKKIVELKDSGIELEDEKMKEFSRNLAFILILRHFTDIPISDGLSSTQLLDVLNKIINIGLFEVVWNEGFEPSQIEWLNSKMMQVATNYAQINTETNEKLLKDMEAAIDVLKKNNGDVESASVQ